MARRRWHATGRRIDACAESARRWRHGCTGRAVRRCRGHARAKLPDGLASQEHVPARLLRTISTPDTRLAASLLCASAGVATRASVQLCTGNDQDASVGKFQLELVLVCPRFARGLFANRLLGSADLSASATKTRTERNMVTASAHIAARQPSRPDALGQRGARRASQRSTRPSRYDRGPDQGPLFG
eukprot:5548534-Prymnesium_polylepis.1